MITDKGQYQMKQHGNNNKVGKLVTVLILCMTKHVLLTTSKKKSLRG